MMDHVLVPSGAGALTQWPTVVGKPTHWEACAAVDDAYIEAQAQTNIRDSFKLDMPALKNEDRIVSAIIRGWIATPPGDPAGFVNGGFEDPGIWVLSSVCDFNGAAINTDPTFVRSGTKSLQINSRVFSGLSTCGTATQTVGGLTIGKNYQIQGFFRTNANVTTQQFNVRKDGTTIATLGSASPSSWTAWGPVTMSATSTSHDISIHFQVSGTAIKTYWFDDLSFRLAVGSGVVTPFYRLNGVNVNLASWTLAAFNPTSVQQPDRAITLSAAQFRDGGFEIGAFKLNTNPVRVDHLQLALSVQPFKSRFGFVGSQMRRR